MKKIGIAAILLLCKSIYCEELKAQNYLGETFMHIGIAGIGATTTYAFLYKYPDELNSLQVFNHQRNLIFMYTGSTLLTFTGAVLILNSRIKALELKKGSALHLSPGLNGLSLNLKF